MRCIVQSALLYVEKNTKRTVVKDAYLLKCGIIVNCIIM